MVHGVRALVAHWQSRVTCIGMHGVGLCRKFNRAGSSRGGTYTVHGIAAQLTRRARYWRAKALDVRGISVIPHGTSTI